jgi:hypothetical protein
MTGASDSHSSLGSEAGHPRTYVAVAEDDPGRLDLPAFLDAMRAGRMVVSAGPFVELWATDAAGGRVEMGEVATAAQGAVTLHARVQAPAWMSVHTLEVVVGCEPGERVALGDEGSVVRFDGDLTVRATRDTHVFVRVYGEPGTDPVMGGSRPYAFTNPVFVDADATGAFEPRP